ncbi:hypothetical protein [Desertivirga xinjiangensis]|uniref:hypothetical protein n=1 Tax=Desertivirga xinjiangensis TaxID=539206 RepID=UPI002108A7DD|nr:hypothetical protein [Pedobacter xinjiangensis]
MKKTLFTVIVFFITIQSIYSQVFITQVEIHPNFVENGNIVVSNTESTYFEINFTISRAVAPSPNTGWASGLVKYTVVYVKNNIVTDLTSEISVSTNDYGGQRELRKVQPVTIGSGKVGGYVTIKVKYVDDGLGIWTNYYNLSSNFYTALPVSGASLMPAAWIQNAELYGTYQPTDFISPSDLPLLTSNGSDASIYSPNQQFRLTLQPDGNLVIYDNAFNPLWNSGTQASGTGWIYKLFYQLDGNITLKRYHTNGNLNGEIWASASQAPSGSLRSGNAYRSYMKLQDDGNLVLYFNGLDGRQWYYGFSSSTYGGRVSHHQGNLKEYAHQ